MRDDFDEKLDDANLVTVAKRFSEIEATIIVTALRDAGIRAVATGGFTAGFRAEAPGIVRVQTLERDAAKAKSIIAELKVDRSVDWDTEIPDEDET